MALAIEGGGPAYGHEQGRLLLLPALSSHSAFGHLVLGDATPSTFFI